MSKVIFIDASRSLQLSNIGGTNSIVRRLIHELPLDEKVVLLDINGKNSDFICLSENVRYKSFSGLFGLLRYLTLEDPSSVIDIYLHPFERLVYGVFRIFYRKHWYGKIYCSWPDSKLKRLLSFADAIFFRYNGPVFCVTERQKGFLEKFFVKTALKMWPPIPKEYFKISTSVDQPGEPIVITWIGRLDKGKGADLAFNILENFLGDGRFELRVLAHSVHNDLSMSIPKNLLNQPNCKIQEVQYNGYDESLDKQVSDLLKSTTIFISPYRLLSSTIDCPMLIQEAAAANCIIVSKAYPIIASIVGNDEYLIPHDLDDETIISASLDKIYQALSDIRNEKSRLALHVDGLDFSSEKVSQQFRKSLPNFKRV
jgi:glycosyltransferase involved in cell wall biosynthesis